MYWGHRFGKAMPVDIMCSLLKKGCLTTGWNCYSNTKSQLYNPAIVAAVELGDFNKVHLLMRQNGVNFARSKNLINFTEMTCGDIVIVLPARKSEPYFYVVRVKSANAKSILKIPPALHTLNNFVTLDTCEGFKFIPTSHIFDIGFFHEVEILDKKPRSSLSGVNDSFPNTNIKYHDNQSYIYDNYIPEKFKSTIPRP